MRSGLWEQWILDITKGQGTEQICSRYLDFVIEVLSTIIRVQNIVRYNVRYIEDRLYTAISRKIVGKNVHATMPKGNMEYGEYTVPNDCSCRTYFYFIEKQWTQNHPQYLSGLLHALYPTTFLEIAVKGHLEVILLVLTKGKPVVSIQVVAMQWKQQEFWSLQV